MASFPPSTSNAKHKLYLPKKNSGSVAPASGIQL